MSKYIVDTNKLWDGRVFKNYRELAREMEWKIARTNDDTYKAQMKQLNSVCRWRKDVDETGKKISNKIIIEEVYDKPLPVPDKRKDKGLQLNFDNYCIPEEHSKSKGIYRIILDNEVYIGSTGLGFRRRFLCHLTDNQPHTKDLIERGGRFELVELMIEPSKKERLMREAYYIDLYLKDENYVVVNQKHEISPIKKTKYKKIMVSEDDYDLAMELLEEYRINLKTN